MIQLTEWRQDSKLTTPTTWDSGITAVIRSQDSIGWKNLLEGLPSKLWTPYIQQYYDESGLQKYSSRWLQRLLTHLHDLAWGQWEHCNQILHHINTPRQARALTHLDTVIAQEFHAYTLSPTPTLKAFFASSLGPLIFQNVSFKQVWDLNLMTVKQHQERFESVTGHPPQVVSNPDDHLLNWIKSGHHY